MKKINNLPMPYDFKRVVCPKCGKFCAAKLLDGPRAGMIECMSNDHIKPCRYFGDDDGKEIEERRKKKNPFSLRLAEVVDSQATLKDEFKRRVVKKIRDVTSHCLDLRTKGEHEPLHQDNKDTQGDGDSI